MRILSYFITMFLVLPAFAQDLAPDVSTKPHLRKSATTSATANRPGTTTVENKEIADADEVDGKPIAVRDKLRLNDRAYAGCLAQLDEMGVVYSEAAPLIPGDDADCGILRPLIVNQVGSGVAIEPAATMRCETAKAIAVWVQDFVLPASKKISDRGRLTVIENGSGFICRRRNNLPDGKLSEHAFGNAFDVMAFQFEDGYRIAIEPRDADGSMGQDFQDTVRASACLSFSTVLGPGSNATHADHLHLDIIERTSGYRICEQEEAAPD